MNQEYALPLCLALGNKKVGRVWTFSLPSVLTCPGASNWCRQHCYAKRFELLRPNCRQAYIRNLALSLEPNRFVAHVLDTLPEDAPLVRIHVGGDYYSTEYLTAWIDICNARPACTFWSYTRGWSIATLRPALDQLRSLSNVQIFASTDVDMPAPPSDWRIAYIETDPRASGLRCRHQQGEVESCLECGYCFREREGNVVFMVH